MTATDKEALISRLESAERGTFVLDAEVWCAMNGYEFVQWDGAGCVYRKPGGGISHELHTLIKPYSVSLDAALALVERAGPYRLYSVDASILDRFRVVLKGPDRQWPADEESDACIAPGWEGGTAKSLPLAICAALLKAKGQDHA